MYFFRKHLSYKRFCTIGDFIFSIYAQRVILRVYSTVNYATKEESNDGDSVDKFKPSYFQQRTTFNFLSTEILRQRTTLNSVCLRHRPLTVNF